MNKTRIILFFFLISHSFYAECLNFATPISKQTETALRKLYQVPGFQTFIVEIEKEGLVTIEVKPLPNENFDAFWDSTNRKIRIHSLRNQQLETLACSILFELHNAKSDKEFRSLYNKAKKGEISKSVYVESVEKMEHRNALECSLFLEKGIQLGVFSEKARWPILQDFDDHYKLQQIMGHSEWIAKNYDSIAPFKTKNRPYFGTLPKLSPQGKEDFLRYLKIKKSIESINAEQNVNGLIALQKEYEKAVTIQAHEKLHIFKMIFQKDTIYQALIQSFRT